MFDLPEDLLTRAVAVASPGDRSTLAPSVYELQGLFHRLRFLDGVGVGEAQLIAQLAAMEKLKGALAAADARDRVSGSCAHRSRGGSRGRGGSALPRSGGRDRPGSPDKPHRGARDLGLAKALVNEMPCTLEALTAGEISEWRATLMARETAVLSRIDRGLVDRELGGRLPSLGDQATVAEARKIGYRLDPGSALRRTRGANSDRFVRPPAGAGHDELPDRVPARRPGRRLQGGSATAC